MKVYLTLFYFCFLPIFLFNKIENNQNEEDKMELEIKSHIFGAELTSVKYNGVERLHDAKTFWNQHSPILFPIVGKLRYDVALIDGEEYPIPKHGFAMNMFLMKLVNIHIDLLQIKKL